MSVQIGRWLPPPDQLHLSNKELHLWRFRLDLPGKQADNLRRFLSVEEQQRADKLLIADKKRQFIVARARLRMLLSRYLETSPESLLFAYGSQGKPRLLTDCDSLQFNLAHSGRWAILGITKMAPVGIDLEQVCSLLNYNQLAERFFTEQEINLISQTPENRQRRTFYRLWTAKESRLKELGTGFSAKKTLFETAPFFRFLPVAKGYLAAVSCSKKFSSITKYHLS